MKNAVFHNPACSNCRQTLELLENEGITIPVIEYLKEPPDERTLKDVCTLLGKRPYDLVRQKEPIFKELGLDAVAPDDDARWYRLLSEHPILLQRPIVVYENKAAVCRPPEDVLNLL